MQNAIDTMKLKMKAIDKKREDPNGLSEKDEEMLE